MGFRYENNLAHQIAAVQAVLSVFHNAAKQANQDGENPTLDISGCLKSNIAQIQAQNQIDKTPDFSNVFDISMETGTGKTYTYTQTMYEMHRQLGVYKFMIVVPTLSIKAGTEQFLKSDALRTHFRTDFDGKYGQAEIKLYVVESQKAKKGKRESSMPSDIVQFVEADNDKHIHVLLLNMGMVNSKTMRGENAGNDGSTLLKDLYHKPFEAIASVKPVMIIDEPHRFDDNNKTWQSLMSLQPQFVLRYGATFNDKFRNLLYRLTAIDAFNQDLVKGVRAHIQEIQGEKPSKIRLIETDGTTAIFEYEKQTFSLNKGDNLAKIHAHISNLFLENLNKTTALLSNGVELKKGEGIYPFSYSQNALDVMLQKAVRAHFETEQTLLSRPDKIKPLTLFFIDDISGYRDEHNRSDSLKNKFEQIVLQEAKKALETAEVGSAFYQSLQSVINDVSATHGGYFSKDNSSDDEKIAKEINEILHDKESLLSLANPRRFIFSKWTLREGWDNPNVFGICKLRSSGSETSKLQEVGRGLRLPVNEYMSRVKNGDFKLNYFVDSSESDFVDRLKAEINQSAEKETIFTALNDELFSKIQAHYEESKKQIRQKLSDLLDDDDNLLGDNVLQKLREIYPLAFDKPQLKGGKVDIAGKKDKTKVKMRVGKYDELKTLWEAINQKAILRYEMSESDTLKLFKAFLLENQPRFTATGVAIKTQELIKIDRQNVGSKIIENNEIFAPLVTLNYRTFLEKLAQKSYIKMQTLHQAFFDLQTELDIARFMNENTVQFIVGGFNRFLLQHSLSSFEVGYQKIHSQMHPTKLTDQQGKPLPEIELNGDWGELDESCRPLDSFLFDKVFFDSQIEKDNITEVENTEVVVFTKITRNAIKIPVAGGGTYSPDFAYIVKTKQGETLNLVVESKGKSGEEALSQVENQKIKHAEKWFREMSGQNGVKVRFETQFDGVKVVELIKRNIDIN